MAAAIQYIQRHWQGDLPFAQTVMVNLLAVRVALWLSPIWPNDLVFLAISGAVLIWQTVGSFRFADIGLRRNGDMFAQFAVYSMIPVVIVLSLVQAIDGVSARFLQPPELVDYAPPILEMRENGGVIVAHGYVDYRLNSSLLATLKAFPLAREVVLSSDGGNIFAGRAMAHTILEHGLDTRVTGDCFSACTIAFMAGGQRVLGPMGQLGFHGYAFDSTLRVQTLDVDEQEAKDRDYFTRRGVGADFLDRVFATKPSELWRPTRAELVAGGVLTP